TAQGAAFGQLSGQGHAPFVVQHPFMPAVSGGPKFVPVITGEHVTADSGTGAVHTAPMHGDDGYVVAEHYGIKGAESLVDGSRKCMSNAAMDAVSLSGLSTGDKGNISVLGLLAEHNALLKKENITHPCPHCWRHETPVMFRATPQWFISMDQAGL